MSAGLRDRCDACGAPARVWTIGTRETARCHACDAAQQPQREQPQREHPLGCWCDRCTRAVPTPARPTVRMPPPDPVVAYGRALVDAVRAWRRAEAIQEGLSAADEAAGERRATQVLATQRGVAPRGAPRATDDSSDSSSEGEGR